jgi:cobalt-zinc-cadmium efflux system protein
VHQHAHAHEHKQHHSASQRIGWAFCLNFGFTAWCLREGATLNERVLNWHLLEDLLGWVAVLLVALVLLVVDWPILDPLLAVVFTGFILLNVLRNLRATLRLLSQAVPEAQLQRRIHARLAGLPAVAGIHHKHLWSLDGEHHVYTAHLVLQWQPGRVQGANRGSEK